MKQGAPDFLCIGPEKTGTSWLHINLSKHPDLFIPPVKSIRYFFEQVHFPDQGLLARFGTDHWHYQKWPSYLKGRWRYYLSSNLLRPRATFQRFRWDLRFLFGAHTDDWYRSLFSLSDARAKGEIAPVYAGLDERSIREIATLFPDFKILIFLRDPIQRVWSKAKMVLCTHTGRNYEQVPQEEFCDFFRQSLVDLSSYNELVNRWKSAFEEENICLRFYDELQADNWRFFCDICRFLGVEPEQVPEELRKSMKAKVGATLPIDLPEHYRIELAQLYRPFLEETAQVFGGHASNWLKQYEPDFNTHKQSE